MSTVITSVDAGSPAERAGIRAGEQLLMINHHEIVDVLDYRFFCYDPSVSLRLREADGDHAPPDDRKGGGRGSRPQF